MFTATGKALAVVAVLLISAGALLNYPELVAVGIAGVVALVIACAWVAFRPEIIAVRDIEPERVTEGERSVARLTVTNRGTRHSPPIIAEETVGERTVSVAIPSLAGGKSYVAEYDLPTSKRGVYNVGPLVMGQSDPFRLMYVGRSFSSQSQLWVYPRIYDVRPVPTGQTHDMDGPTSSSAPQGGVAFHAIRDWVWGDDFRLIHWLSTARVGTLQIRQMVVPDEPRILVVLDTSAESYTDEFFEDAVRVAASLMTSASRHGYPATLRTTGGVTASADKDGLGLLSVMDLLAAVTATPQDPGLVALTRMVPDEPGVSLAVVTGQAASQQIAAVGTVRSRFQMVSLAQVGERHGRPAAPPRGVVGVNVATSDDFGPSWDRLVRR